MYEYITRRPPRFNQGEIAITVKTRFRENRGKIVRLQEYLGLHDWPGISVTVHVWLVECLCPETKLYYHYPYHRDLKTAHFGQMPECYLQRISTPSGQGVLDLQGVENRIFDSDVSL